MKKIAVIAVMALLLTGCAKTSDETESSRQITDTAEESNGLTLPQTSENTQQYATEEMLPEQSIDDYIVSVIPKYLDAQAVDVSGTVKYSSPVPEYDFSDNTVCGEIIFIIDDSGLIGKMDISSTSDGYNSTFNQGITDEMNSAYLNGEGIAYGFLEGDGSTVSEWLYTEADGFIFVDGLDNGNSPTNPPEELNTITVSAEC